MIVYIYIYTYLYLMMKSMYNARIRTYIYVLFFFYLSPLQAWAIKHAVAGISVPSWIRPVKSHAWATDYHSTLNVAAKPSYNDERHASVAALCCRQWVLGEVEGQSVQKPAHITRVATSSNHKLVFLHANKPQHASEDGKRPNYIRIHMYRNLRHGSAIAEQSRRLKGYPEPLQI